MSSWARTRVEARVVRARPSAPGGRRVPRRRRRADRPPRLRGRAPPGEAGARPGPTAMSIEPIGLGDLVAERRALAERVTNVFATPEFHETWWRHFGRGPGAPARSGARWRQARGRPAGLRVAQAARRRVAVPRPWLRRRARAGRGGSRPRARRRRVRALVPRTGVRGARAPRVDERARRRVVLEEESPIISVSSFAGWDDYLASRSSNFRQQVRNRERRLRRATTCFRRAAHESTLASDLDTLFRLHRARWRGQRLSRARGVPSRLRARRARAWVDASRRARVDGRPAARGTASASPAPTPTSSPAATLPSSGSRSAVVLSAHVRDAFESSQAEYRFLRGDEPYKFRFTDSHDRIETIVTGSASAPARSGSARAAIQPSASQTAVAISAVALRGRVPSRRPTLPSSSSRYSCTRR